MSPAPSIQEVCECRISAREELLSRGSFEKQSKNKTRHRGAGTKQTRAGNMCWLRDVPRETLKGALGSLDLSIDSL